MKEELNKLKAENEQLKQTISVDTSEKYQKLYTDYTSLLSKSLTSKLNPPQKFLEIESSPRNEVVNAKFKKFLSRGKKYFANESPEAKTVKRGQEGSISDRRRSNSKLSGYSNRNRQVMNEVTNKVNSLILCEIKKEIAKKH
jgi:hypothetical protein